MEALLLKKRQPQRSIRPLKGILLASQCSRENSTAGAVANYTDSALSLLRVTVCGDGCWVGGAMISASAGRLPAAKKAVVWCSSTLMSRASGAVQGI